MYIYIYIPLLNNNNFDAFVNKFLTVMIAW